MSPRPRGVVTSHRPKRDGRRAKETFEIKRENHQLRRKLSQLRREVEKFEYQEPERLYVEESPPGDVCMRCSSGLSHFVTPGGTVVRGCRSCGYHDGE